MVRRPRSQLPFISGSAVCTLVALCAISLAQPRPDLECKPTETQAECHARLKCKPTEEVAECQKRLAESPKDGNTGQRNDAENRDAGRDDGNRDAGREERRDDRRDDRGDDRRRDDRSDRNRDSREDDSSSRRQRGDDRRGSRRGSGGSRKGFESNKTFGLGLELGQPSGLNGKYFLSDSGALDFGIGFIYRHYYYGDGIHLYGDYLWHPTSLVSAAAFELPLYVGVGLRYWDFDYCEQRNCSFGGSAIGIRVPIGIAFDFNRIPLDIFIQLVPVLDFLNGDYYDRYNDRVNFGIDFSAGVRYWFK